MMIFLWIILGVLAFVLGRIQSKRAELELRTRILIAIVSALMGWNQDRSYRTLRFLMEE